jgi:hypothetical protein
MEVIRYIIDEFKATEDNDINDLRALKECYSALTANCKNIAPSKCKKCKQKFINNPMSSYYNKNNKCSNCEPIEIQPFNHLFLHKDVLMQIEEQSIQEGKKQMKQDLNEITFSFIKPPCPGLPKVMKATITNLNLKL